MAARFDRRLFLAALGASVVTGCRSTPTAEVRDVAKPDMIGTQQAGTETFDPLVTQSVTNLLMRNAQPVAMPDGTLAPPMPKRICFVALENKSAEEIGDFKEQLYQMIDTQIVQSQVFIPISKRYVDAGLTQTRLRPDSLLVPQNMAIFAAAMQQQGQPFDYLLYAVLTSGTTRDGKEMQRDYLLTMDMIRVDGGAYDKQTATISKGYYHSKTAKWMSNLGLKR